MQQHTTDQSDKLLLELVISEILDVNPLMPGGNKKVTHT